MKMSKIFFRILFVMVLLFLKKAIATAWNREAVHFMEPGDWIDNDKPGLQIFCHNAKTKYIINIWKIVVMTLKTNLETYELYEGRSPHEVIEKHEDNQKYWRFSLFSTKKSKQFTMNPFDDNCIGVFMNQHNNQYLYRMIMSQNTIDTWKITMMAVGVFLFWYAQKLSRNTLFYYTSGVGIGVSLSILILIYLIGKILPKGKFMYMMMATGYTMSIYVAQMLWENAQLIGVQYRDYVIYYILATSLISFLICYRFGPVTNTRTKTIIQWILQIFGLVLIYHSSYFREASTFFCMLLVFFYNFPIIFLNKGRKYWKNMFPEKSRLLTEDEYRKEAIRETKKALNGLKQYCNSPDCSPWKTVLRLKDPIRFAKFMEGENHLSEDESIEHDVELTKLIEECDYTDEEFEEK